MIEEHREIFCLKRGGDAAAPVESLPELMRALVKDPALFQKFTKEYTQLIEQYRMIARRHTGRDLTFAFYLNPGNPGEAVERGEVWLDAHFYAPDF